MKKIKKGNAPEFWVSFIKRNPDVRYKDLNTTPGGSEVRNELRKYLTQEQKCICAYCCSALSENKSHNEHIKPKSVYTKLTMDYRNIIVSCTRVQGGDDSSCGMEKEDKYDERLFVSPLEDECAKHFIFYSNGSIDSDTDRGKYTIDLLHLNESKSLKASRKTQYATVYQWCSDEVVGLCQDISSRRVEEYEIAKDIYEEFFKEEIAPKYFSENDGKLPAYIDMLEYFKEQGRFDFDNIVTDLALLGELQLGVD